MKKAKSVALIGAGNFTDSSLARFWSLSEMLGPVKAPSFRLASRIANYLGAGYPVKDFADLDACSLILISVPDDMLSHVVSELSAAKIRWRGKAVVLCGTWLDSLQLSPLASRGASTGSINTIPGFDDSRYLIEGDRPAVLQAKRLVENGERQALATERHLKPLFLTAMTCTGSLLIPLLMAASESLRHAGVPSWASASILEKQVDNSLRSFLRGGRRAYQEPREFSRQLHALSIADPSLASYVELSSRLASRLVEARQPVIEKRQAPRLRTMAAKTARIQRPSRPAALQRSHFAAAR